MIATYSLNSVHNGIEITFDSFPGKEILNKLHAIKWRWHKYKYKRCWYNR